MKRDAETPENSNFEVNQTFTKVEQVRRGNFGASRGQLTGPNEARLKSRFCRCCRDEKPMSKSLATKSCPKPFCCRH